MKDGRQLRAQAIIQTKLKIEQWFIKRQIFSLPRVPSNNADVITIKTPLVWPLAHYHATQSQWLSKKTTDTSKTLNGQFPIKLYLAKAESGAFHLETVKVAD